jgi:hypothetical protein
VCVLGGGGGVHTMRAEGQVLTIVRSLEVTPPAGNRQAIACINGTQDTWGQGCMGLHESFTSNSSHVTRYPSSLPLNVPPALPPSSCCSRSVSSLACTMFNKVCMHLPPYSCHPEPKPCHPQPHWVVAGPALFQYGSHLPYPCHTINPSRIVLHPSSPSPKPHLKPHPRPHLLCPPAPAAAVVCPPWPPSGGAPGLAVTHSPPAANMCGDSMRQGPPREH